MWTHCLQMLDDQYPDLFSPWLIRGMSMWPWNADDTLSRAVSCRRGYCCMIWSVAMENAVSGSLMLELLLFGDVGTGLLVSAVSSVEVRFDCRFGVCGE